MVGIMYEEIVYFKPKKCPIKQRILILKSSRCDKFIIT